MRDEADQLERSHVIDVRKMPDFDSKLLDGYRPIAVRAEKLANTVLHSFRSRTAFMAWVQLQDATLTVEQ